jgi:Ca2+-transporting ATPase
VNASLLQVPWHHLPLDEVIDLLETDPRRGLDVFAVRRRQEQFGPNLITRRRGKSPLVRFLLQFHNPLIYILLVASVITLVLKDAIDAAIIFGVVLVNAILGYLQESRSERAIEALAQTMVTEATVVRAGATTRISATELAPGDLVLLQTGDKVPADLRLIRARELQIAEAALTGESAPVAKAAEVTLERDTPLADRRNMAYASTLVISGLIATAEELQTPLTRKIARFSLVLLYLILTLAGLSILVEALRGRPLIDALMAAIALSVSAIPEGLPAAVTVTLAIGVSRMARRRAIIRKLPAVETLGSTTVICSDKTGTLTQNQMTVQRIVVHGACFEVSGAGYRPEGEIIHHGRPIDPAAWPALLECLRAGLLCNDSQLVEQQGRWEVQGDPTEGALLVVATKAGLRPDAHRAALPRLDAIPFESQRQYMATLHDAGQTHVVYIKGASEVLLPLCRAMLDADGSEAALDVPGVQRQVEAMAADGLRVLAFARRAVPATMAYLSHADVATDLVFLGLQGMADPPRPEAIAAVQACQQAGIQVKMITGDHALTAAAIARQIGIMSAADTSAEPSALTGKQLAALSDAELMGAVDRAVVFARVTPEQKLRLVEALQARGHVVAMTGDGVNDAPALKQADIGVAMGLSGTDVAKEAADMVLTDDNFATIAAAVEEGRGVFDNLTKIIAWTLPTNLGEGLIILAAVVAGLSLPILPIQILWINMTTVAVLGLVLALEQKEPDIMRRVPPMRRSSLRSCSGASSS